MATSLIENLLPQELPITVKKAISSNSIVSRENDECDCNEVSYGTGDAVFSCFAVAPLVVGVWRGTWGVMEIYGEMFPYAQIYILGIVIHICYAILGSQLFSRSTGAWSDDGGAGRWLRERVISRIYTYTFILSCIMHWRGGWGLLDATIVAILPNDDDLNRTGLLAAFTVLFYVFIVGLRASRNLLASPYFLVTDGKEPTYIFTTRFKKVVSILYVIRDLAFCPFLIHSY